MQHAQSAAGSTTREEGTDFIETCSSCEKSFYSLKSWQNHYNSRSHARKVRESLPDNLHIVGVYDPVEDGQSDDNILDSESELLATVADTEFVPSECLFCTLDSPDLSQNIAHMLKMHGLFIPDQKHLIDVESFVSYLYTIISDFHECLYCGSSKSTAEATRSHMRDRGHCKLNFESEGELELFWERDDGMDEAESEPPLARMSFPATGSLLSGDEDSLHLSSGKVIGHRSQLHPLRHVPKSTPQPTDTERKAITDGSTSRGTTVDQRTGRQVVTRAHGGTGLIGVPQKQRRALIAVEKMMMKVELRARNRYELNLEKASNRTGQKHYKVCRIIFQTD